MRQPEAAVRSRPRRPGRATSSAASPAAPRYTVEVARRRPARVLAHTEDEFDMLPAVGDPRRPAARARAPAARRSAAKATSSRWAPTRSSTASGCAAWNTYADGARPLPGEPGAAQGGRPPGRRPRTATTRRPTCWRGRSRATPPTRRSSTTSASRTRRCGEERPGAQRPGKRRSTSAPSALPALLKLAQADARAGDRGAALARLARGLRRVAPGRRARGRPGGRAPPPRGPRRGGARAAARLARRGSDLVAPALRSRAPGRARPRALGASGRRPRARARPRRRIHGRRPATPTRWTCSTARYPRAWRAPRRSRARWRPRTIPRSSTTAATCARGWGRTGAADYAAASRLSTRYVFPQPRRSRLRVLAPRARREPRRRDRALPARLAPPRGAGARPTPCASGRRRAASTRVPPVLHRNLGRTLLHGGRRGRRAGRLPGGDVGAIRPTSTSTRAPTRP